MLTLSDYIVYVATPITLWLILTQTKERYRLMNLIMFLISLALFGPAHAVAVGNILALFTFKQTE